MVDNIQPPKKPRGNPQFQLNKKPKPMAEEEVKKETTQAEQPASPPPSDTLPSDLFSNKMPGEEVLPLDGEVKSKTYAALPGDGGTPPPTGGEQKSFESGAVPTATAATPAVAPPTPAEVQSQAEQTVSLIIKGYEKLHSLGRWIGKIDPSELTALHAQGKINLEQNLPLGKKSITVGGFFQEYNAGIDENIVVSEEFKTVIRPPLQRLVVKYNILLDDLMFVGVTVTEDLVTKTSMLLGLKKSCNMVLEAVIAMQKAATSPPPREEKKREPVNMDPPATEDAEWREPSTK